MYFQKKRHRLIITPNSWHKQNDESPPIFRLDCYRVDFPAIQDGQFCVVFPEYQTRSRSSEVRNIAVHKRDC